MRWDDVNARARGLATHLLDRSTLAGLSGAPDWPAFVARVTALGYPLDLAGGATVEPGAFDRAVSLVASARLHLLGRWLSSREGVLAVVLEDEEFRTVRSLLRGAAEGASPGARLRASTPTPHLPMRALERMARAASVPELVRELLRIGHPAGRAWQDVLRQADAPDLRELEWALARLFTERAVRAARAGGPVVRRFAAELVNQENAWTLLLAAPLESGSPADRDFLPGGIVLTREQFARLRAERDGDRVLQELRRLLEGTALGAALSAEPFDIPSLEQRAASARIAWLRGLARRDPLGPAVVLSVLERIRAEARALRAIGWGVAFGAPAQALARLTGEAA
jgi:vacuolar-type H+-ATPase subunit C/Vma6